MRGLEGIIAAPTAICELDGINGRLLYGGYDIADLAEHATFEDVVYLLWNGELPTADQRAALSGSLADQRAIPDQLVQSLRLYPRGANSMAALRAAIAQLGLYDAESESIDTVALRRIGMRLTAQLPTIVAANQRIQEGRDPISPRRDLGHAANFLYMLSGREPSEGDARALDVSLILYAEHEMNASSFAARVAASTLSDIYSAVTAGVATIKGPLHGGAGEAVMRTLEEIGTVENVEPFATAALAAKRRFMGFGHRVYKNGDPRAVILRAMADEATQRTGDRKWFDMSVALHGVVYREKKLHPNVDFYSASLFAALGIPAELNVPIITIARIAGWTAQLFEQYADNRIFRPRAAYVGPAPRAFPRRGQ
ncbi:MAG: citrate synthase [Chloroflexota bacterium]|nr:MAG: citrate synthase [Chloroflexota bacterium]